MSGGFSSLVTTAVTLPGLGVLTLMAAYYLRHRYGSQAPRRGFYLLAALLLPMLILFVRWPSYGYYGFDYAYSGSYRTECVLLLCLYAVFYAVGLLCYAFCRMVTEESRQKVFNFFFVALAAVVTVSLCLDLPRYLGLANGRTLLIVMLIAVLAFLAYHTVDAGAELLRGPHRRIMFWMMVVFFPACTVVYMINVWYVPLVGFWVWVAVQSIIWNKPPDACEMQPAAVGTHDTSPLP